MFVIGIDSHKDTLSACLVDHLGTALEYRSIPNTPAGHRQLIDWAHTTAARVAVEGSGTFGRPAAVAAMAAGLDIREVPPQLTAQVSAPLGFVLSPCVTNRHRRSRAFRGQSRHRG